MSMDIESLRMDAYAYLAQRELEPLGDSPFASFVRALVDLDLRADTVVCEPVEVSAPPSNAVVIDAWTGETEPAVPAHVDGILQSGQAPVSMPATVEIEDANSFAVPGVDTPPNECVAPAGVACVSALPRPQREAQGIEYVLGILRGDRVIPSREELAVSVASLFNLDESACRQVVLMAFHDWEKEERSRHRVAALANIMKAPISDAEVNKKSKAKDGIDACMEWLRSELANGERASVEMDSLRLERGVADYHYAQAKKVLGVVSARRVDENGNGRWFLSLPG